MAAQKKKEPEQKEPTRDFSRGKTFILGAVIGIVLYIAVSAAAVKVIDTYQKIRWALDYFEQFNNDGGTIDVTPAPWKKDKDAGGDFAKWIRKNLPPKGAADYKAVGETFRDTAAKLRAGTLNGKAEAYADTARELARKVDRGTWEPFLVALVKRAEKEPGDLADLFDTAGKAIEGEAAAPAKGGSDG